jgi:hypothetical protein
MSKNLCDCRKELASKKKSVDTITVKDPINKNFKLLTRNYISGNIIYLNSIEDVNVGAAIVVGTDPAKVIVAVDRDMVTLQSSLSKPYPKNTVVSVDRLFPHVRVYLNLPFSSFVQVKRNNDNRGIFTTNHRVGADQSIVIRKDVAQFGATAHWGKPYSQKTESISIVPKTLGSADYKACFEEGLSASFC